jgi:glycosyltransferase involved in cell wall biosynthesis
MSPPARIAFLNTHPIQYKAPLYAYLNSAPDLDVSALYMSDFSVRGAMDPGFGQRIKWDIDLLGGYRPVFLGAGAQRREPNGFFSMVAPEAWGEVRSGRYDALVIHGHNFAGHHVALAAARSIGLPVFMRSETHLGLLRSGLKAGLRRPLMGSLYAQCDGFFAIGSANREFYRAMGVPDEKIFLVPYTVDNERLANASDLTPERRRAVRAELGVTDERPIILFAAKFQRRKHPDDLIAAARLLHAQGLRFQLSMIGSGEMEAALKAMAADLPEGVVRFHGFMNQAQLPQAYAASDVFVLPSTNEPWGLAINEAMACGLPIVASTEIGAVRDIVHDGINGRTFVARDVDGLAEALTDVVADPAQQAAMSAASRDIISRWSYAECLQGVRDALAYLDRKRLREAVV